MRKDFDIHKLVRDNIKGLKTYSSARDEFNSGDDKLVFLDANENPNENGVNRYPDPQQIILKSRLSQLKNLPINKILLGNGSDEILDLLVRVFCEPKIDNVIILPPTYGMYKVLANVNDVEIREVMLDKNFQPKVEEILNAADDKTKMLFICSPNNPTSNLFEFGLIEKLVNNFNGLVVIDEAYIDFTDSESWISKINVFPNLVVTQTLSKAFGMAGIRLGTCYASPEIISVLNKIKPPYNVNQLTQQRALNGLVDSRKIQDQVIQIRNERDKLMKKMKTFSFVKNVFASDANFILVLVDKATKRYNQFREHGIIVRNRSKEPLCENCLRFTIGTPAENKKLLHVMAKLSEI